MPDGHIEDPKMNTLEKDFGILVSEELDEFGKCKKLVYIKDQNSRSYTSGTPVEFEEQDWDTGIPLDYRKGNATVKLARILSINQDEIAKQPIVRNLNIFAKVLLELNEDDLKNLMQESPEEIENALKRAVERLVCPP